MLLVFFGYVLLRFILSPDFSLIALRDAAPYLYAAIAILSAHSYHASSEAARMRTIRLLQFGLRIHIVWVLVALAIPTAVAELPTLDPAGHVTYLLLRQDFDGAMLGVFVGLALNRSWKGTSSRSDYLFVVIAAAEVAMMGNRSGLLALLAGIVTSVLALLAWQSTDKRSRARKLTLIAAVPIVTVFALAVLSQTPAGSKLAASLGLVLPQSDIQFTGVGTQRARSAAWPVVIDYMSNDTARALVGVGFGPNFMVDSGAIMQLVGSDTPDVRSPHNYLVGTYARLGLIGLVLFLGLTIAICRQIIRIRSTLVHDELLMFAALVCVTVLVVSMFGVVLESPFGAVPFFWSAGLLLGQPIVKRECASSVGRSRLMGVGHRPG